MVVIVIELWESEHYIDPKVISSYKPKLQSSLLLHLTAGVDLLASAIKNSELGQCVYRTTFPNNFWRFCPVNLITFYTYFTIRKRNYERDYKLYCINPSVII